MISVFLLTLLASIVATPVHASDDDALAAALAGLKHASFNVKRDATEALGASEHPRAAVVLEALLDGRLFERRSDERLVVRDKDVPLVDAATGELLDDADAADLKRIVVNNQMRTEARKGLARIRLHDDDASTRKAAVEALIGSASPETIAVVGEAIATELDAAVREAMALVLALDALESPDAARRLAAVDTLSGSLRSEVYNRVTRLLEAESDPDVRAAAEATLRSIDLARSWYGFVETLFFGLSLGFVLVLAAIGLAITFGVMGVINMAHGELIMLGAYTTWIVQQWMPDHLDLSLLVAVPAAFVVAALVGLAIERGVVRFLYGRPLETLLATFGLSLVLQQAVRSIFSPLNRAVATPQWMSGQWVINDALALTYNRLYIILFSLAVFLALVALLRFTTLGLQVRAVAQNRDMARAMGTRAGWIDAATFALGSGVAGLAGVALSQLTNVGPNLGQSHIIDSFMVVVFGGVGNLWGTLVAGLSLGVASKFLEPFAGAVLAKIAVLIFIILFIQKKPRGLFPQRGRAASV